MGRFDLKRRETRALVERTGWRWVVADRVPHPVLDLGDRRVTLSDPRFEASTVDVGCRATLAAGLHCPALTGIYRTLTPTSYPEHPTVAHAHFALERGDDEVDRLWEEADRRIRAWAASVDLEEAKRTLEDAGFALGGGYPTHLARLVEVGAVDRLEALRGALGGERLHRSCLPEEIEAALVLARGRAG